MAHIFVSHVEEDADIALEIALGLEEAGYTTWCYELDSIPGPSYLLQTGQAIEQSEAVVLVISPHSLGSHQVTREVVRAYEGVKQFVPVLRDVTHVEFQNRQPEWREAVGAATSIQITREGVAGVVARVIGGLKALGIQPKPEPDVMRIDLIRGALRALGVPSVPAREPREQPERGVEVALPAKPAEAVERVEPRKPGERRVSNWWWLPPVLIGFVGGIVSFVKNRKANPRKAAFMLISGIAVTVTWGGLTVIGLALPGVISEPEAVFEVSNLIVSPMEAGLEQTVTIKVDVENVGERGSHGAYTVELEIDGVIEDSEEVILAGGETETVTFTFTRTVEGSYNVDVNGLTVAITVNEIWVKPLVGYVPQGWYLKEEIPPEELGFGWIKYAKTDPTAKGYIWIIYAYSSKKGYEWDEDALIAEAVKFPPDLNSEETGTMTVAGAVAGYDEVYDPEIDLHIMNVVFVKGVTFVVVQAAYDKLYDESHAISLINSISF